MLINSLQIDKFKGIRNFKLNFNNGVTVLIGENGTGKTTILDTIYHILTYNTSPFSDMIMENNIPDLKSDVFMEQDASFQGCELVLDLSHENGMLSQASKAEFGLLSANISEPLKLSVKPGNRITSRYGNWGVLNYISSLSAYEVKNRKTPRIIYLPAEISFKKYKALSVKRLDKSTDFGILFDSERISSGLKDFLVYQHYRDLEDKESGKEGSRIKKYKDLYNSFFEDKEFIGIKDMEPLFRIKSTGETHSVDELSSGEKQIFFRAGSILGYELENSIILIDEPEISMHPEWQQKILDFYRKVAGNNQLIIATHSPHIISSCKKEEVRVLVKDGDRTEIKDAIEGTYGRTIEQLLLSVFDLDSVRYHKVQEKIDKFQKLYIDKEHLDENETNKMKKLENELKSYLDPDDPELAMLDIKENTNKLKNLIIELEGNKNA